jgi:hypothetical protein
LDEQKAAVEKAAGCARFVFAVPAKELVETPEDWRRLRLGLAVRWTGGANGEDRQRERFLHVDHGAPHTGLSPRPEDWDALDLDEYAHLVTDRKARIVIPFTQPMDGKATVVIEDAQGRRVRNLLSGAPRAKGAQTLVWDGLDDDGQLVQAGTYRWRSIHHPGVTPEYLMSFCNGDEKVTFSIASNHQHFVAAGANAKYVFFAAAMTEGGFAMMAVDHQGAFKHGYNPIMGSGMDGIAVAADEKFLYAAHDGQAWGQNIDRNKPDWKGTVTISLTRFDIESAGTADYPNGQRFAKLEARSEAGHEPERHGVGRWQALHRKPERRRAAGRGREDGAADRLAPAPRAGSRRGLEGRALRLLRYGAAEGGPGDRQGHARDCRGPGRAARAGHGRAGAVLRLGRQDAHGEGLRRAGQTHADHR